MSPQTQNGYTRIANEIFDALARTRIPGEQRQCLDFILRKTYGYNKKEDAISNSQFCEATGLKKGNVSRSIKALVNKNIVIKNDNTKIPTYQFNKHYTQWRELSKKQPVIKNETAVIKNDKNLLSEVMDTKDNKDNLQKTKESKPKNPPIFNPKDFRPDWIEEKDWDDILIQRKKKKAAITERALSALLAQLKLSTGRGFTVSECVDEITNRGWAGFKDEWMKGQPQSGSGMSAAEETKRMLAEKLGDTGLSRAGQRTAAASMAWLNRDRSGEDE